MFLDTNADLLVNILIWCNGSLHSFRRRQPFKFFVKGAKAYVSIGKILGVFTDVGNEVERVWEQ